MDEWEGRLSLAGYSCASLPIIMSAKLAGWLAGKLARLPTCLPVYQPASLLSSLGLDRRSNVYLSELPERASCGILEELK